MRRRIIWWTVADHSDESPVSIIRVTGQNVVVTIHQYFATPYISRRVCSALLFVFPGIRGCSFRLFSRVTLEAGSSVSRRLLTCKGLVSVLGWAM